MSSNDFVEEGKRVAGIAAARLAEPGWILGLGTGSTTAYAIQELGRRIREEGATYLGIPTSHTSEILARKQGIPIVTLYDVDNINLAIDGADEVDQQRNLIKGSGAAHTKEKIVDSFADVFIAVVDDTKIVSRLGETMRVPLEVLSLSVPGVVRKIEELGGSAILRENMGGGRGHYGPIITDQGNLVLDARFPVIENPQRLEYDLNAIPGVVENGIFASLNPTLLIGSTTDGSVQTIN